MRKLLPILSLALILFGCKKSEQTKTAEPQKEQTKYPVTFTVSDFDVSKVSMSLSGSKSTLAVGDTLKNHVDNLYYRVYNSNGVWVNSIDQASTLATFGKITDALPSGTYTVSMIASKSTLAVVSGNTVSLDNAFYYPSPSSVWNDTFSKTFSLTVGTAAVSQAVRLDRIVAGLQVTLEDAIPTDVSKISLYLNPECYSFQVNGTTSYASSSRVIEYTLAATDKGLKNKTLSICVGNTTSTSSVSIRAYNSTGTLLFEKTVPNLKFEKSKRTILTGSLFSTTASTSTGFTVAVNPTWTTTTPVKF